MRVAQYDVPERIIACGGLMRVDGAMRKMVLAADYDALEAKLAEAQQEAREALEACIEDLEMGGGSLLSSVHLAKTVLTKYGEKA